MQTQARLGGDKPLWPVLLSGFQSENSTDLWQSCYSPHSRLTGEAQDRAVFQVVTFPKAGAEGA